MSKYSAARSAMGNNSSNAPTSYHPNQQFDDNPPPQHQYRPPTNQNNNNHSNGNNNNNNNNNNSNNPYEDDAYKPTYPSQHNNNNRHNRRVPPPKSVHSRSNSNSSKPTSYHRSPTYNASQSYNNNNNNNNNNHNNNNNSQQRPNPPPPSNTTINQNGNSNNRPPKSRSTEHHQHPHDYPEYVQHQLNQENQKQNNNNNQRRYPQSEAKYNGHHNNFNNNAPNQRNNYPISEQDHYRGNQRKEIQVQSHSLQAISSKLPRRPRRPFRVQNENNKHNIFPIQLKSNSTRIKFNCEQLIKYDIEFIPPVAEDAKNIRRNAIQKCYKDIQALYGTFFDDNTRVYAEKEVKQTKTFYYDGDKRIELKFGQKLKVQQLDLQYKKQIQGIFLQSLLRKADLKRFGRGHFDMNKQARLPIKGLSQKFPKNLSLLPGYRTSLETTVSGVRIGIDTCHRLIEDRTVQELMDLFRRDVEASERPQNSTEEYIQNRYEGYCNEKLLGRHIQLFTNGKLYRVDRIDWNLNIYSKVPDYDITIKDHWAELYDVELVNEERGIIVHYSKLKKNEKHQQIVFIPPEICCLTGVSADHRNQRSVTTTISRATKIPAHHRMRSTNKLVEKFQRISNQDPDLKNYVDIPDNQTTEMKGQVLACPRILLTNRDKQIMTSGPEMLQFDWKSCTFMEKGSKIAQWAIVYEDQEAESIDSFIRSLKQYAAEGGFAKAFDEMAVKRIPVNNNNKWTWHNVILRSIDDINEENRQKGCNKLLECIIAVLPSNPQRITDRIYSEVKKVCSTEKAILSQCILSKHTSKNHVINGVLRQLLVKLGSIPWKIEFDLPFKKLDIISKPTMIIGINVNHAQKCNASAVGFAASFDRDFVRYFSRVIHQKQGTECIATHDLMPVVEQAFENFKKINKCYPIQIIVYRDGISETQIEACVNQELIAFQKVISKYSQQNINIKLQFIAVQKRVNARFLISNNLESAPPGTAINDVVVSNQFWDFYLVPSKPPPKCVAIPTRCIVIYDELQLSDENGQGEMDLMHFTNSLCTLYFNWPGPTRVPAPIKYAQKIAQQYCQTLPQKHPHQLLWNSYHFL